METPAAVNELIVRTAPALGVWPRTLLTVTEYVPALEGHRFISVNALEEEPETLPPSVKLGCPVAIDMTGENSRQPRR